MYAPDNGSGKFSTDTYVSNQLENLSDHERWFKGEASCGLTRIERGEMFGSSDSNLQCLLEIRTSDG